MGGLTLVGLGTSIFNGYSAYGYSYNAEHAVTCGKMFIALDGGTVNTMAYSYDGLTWG